MNYFNKIVRVKPENDSELIQWPYINEILPGNEDQCRTGHIGFFGQPSLMNHHRGSAAQQAQQLINAFSTDQKLFIREST